MCLGSEEGRPLGGGQLQSSCCRGRAGEEAEEAQGLAGSWQGWDIAEP